jgi:ADP-heptose:LPS heptosyltransferase
MIDARWRGARRILAVRLDNLGDVLVTTPAMHAIKRSLPAAEIVLLASPVGAQAGKLDPDLAGVIEYEAPWVDPWRLLPHDSAREQAMVERLRAERFDAAVIFTSFRQSSLPAAYLCYLAGIPLRLGISIDASGSLLTTRHRPADRPMHEVERGLDLVAQVGITTDETDLVLEVPAGATREAQNWLDAERIPPAVLRPGPLVIVHPGCSMPARTAPPEQFAEIVAALIERLQATVVITGAAHERDLIATVVDRLPHALRSSVHVMAGELPFPAFCGLVQTADLVVTNNTGPMHIAAAVKTPVVALFALTNPPEQWGPWQSPHRLLFHDVPCRLCYSRACPHNQECLRLVSTDQVVNAAAALSMEQTSAGRDREVALAGGTG